jgi:hypothetical protein
MARLPISKSVQAVTERFVRGGLPINSTPLLSLTAKPVTGFYALSFVAKMATLTNTVTVQPQEFTVTAAGDDVVIAVGDLFIPVAPAYGSAAANVLDPTVTFVPSLAITAHKIALNIVNLTAAATNPNDVITVSGLLVKFA